MLSAKLEEVVRSGENPAREAVMVRGGLQGDRKVATFQLRSDLVLPTLSPGPNPLGSLLDLQVLSQKARVGSETLRF